MRSKDTCPSCGEPVSPGDLLCGNCELILDPGQLPDRPSGELSVVRRMLEVPQRGVPSARPARRPGVAEEREGRDGPTRVFTLGRDRGVPLVVASLTKKAARLSELEAFVVSFIDGASDVPELARKAGLGVLELGVVLQALHEKMIVDFADETPSGERAHETLGDDDAGERVPAPTPPPPVPLPEPVDRAGRPAPARPPSTEPMSAAELLEAARRSEAMVRDAGRPVHEADAVEPVRATAGESIIFASSWPTVHPDFQAPAPRDSPPPPTSGVVSAAFVASPTPRTLEPVAEQPSIIVAPLTGSAPALAEASAPALPPSVASVPTPVALPAPTPPEMPSGPVPVPSTPRVRRTLPGGGRITSSRPAPPLVLDRAPGESPVGAAVAAQQRPVAPAAAGAPAPASSGPTVAPPTVLVARAPLRPSPGPAEPTVGRAETRPELPVVPPPALADVPPPSSDPRIISRGKANQRVLDALKQVKRRDAPNEPAPVREPVAETAADRHAAGSLQVALRMEQNGRLEEAIRYLEKSIAQSPDAPSLYNRLAIILMRERADLRRAEQLLQTAVELAPDNPVYATNLKAVLAKRAMKR